MRHIYVGKYHLRIASQHTVQGRVFIRQAFVACAFTLAFECRNHASHVPGAVPEWQLLRERMGPVFRNARELLCSLEQALIKCSLLSMTQLSSTLNEHVQADADTPYAGQADKVVADQNEKRMQRNATMG